MIMGGQVTVNHAHGHAVDAEADTDGALVAPVPV